MIDYELISDAISVKTDVSIISNPPSYEFI